MQENSRLIVKRGFSLMELLIVIVIIVVLASVSFFVASRLRSSARSAVCMSNLKQMHALATIQVGDLGSYPAVVSQTKDENGKISNKGDHFYGLIGSPPCVSCPDAEFTGPHPSSGDPISAYGANPMVMPNSVNNSPPLVKPHQISRPSEVILLTDGAQFRQSNPRALGYSAIWWGSRNGNPATARSPLTTALVNDSGFWGPVSQIPLRHNGKANVVFCDGHIITISGIDELQERNLYWNY